MRHYLNTPDGAIYGFAPEPPKGLPTLSSEGVGAKRTMPGSSSRTLTNTAAVSTVDRHQKGP